MTDTMKDKEPRFAWSVRWMGLWGVALLPHRRLCSCLGRRAHGSS